MDWTAIIQTAIGGGGIVGLFLITERKTAAALKNERQGWRDDINALETEIAELAAMEAEEPVTEEQ